MFKKTILLLTLIFSFFHISLHAAKVALLVMATGKYIEFTDPLINSAEENFCEGHDVTYYIFTDADLASTDKVVYIKQARLGWPYDTLMRFQTYLDHRDVYSENDFVFACDADMLFVGKVGDEILGKRVAVLHPGFYNKPRSQFTYETNPISRACIRPYEGKHYYCGGIYGGTNLQFIKLLKTVTSRIEDDLANDFIAIWHDESHLNRYFLDHRPTVQLSPSYCYPEGLDIPFVPRLMALNKNHAEMRK